VKLFRRSAEHRRERALRTAAPGPLRDFLVVAPPGPETPLTDLALLAVDIETTGLDPRRDRVLSIGWLPVDGGRVRLGGAGRVVVRDGGGAAGVGQSATVHGLTDDRLSGGVPLEDAVACLLAALTGRVLLAHFAQIETGFLNKGIHQGSFVKELNRASESISDRDAFKATIKAFEAATNSLVEEKLKYS